MTRTENTIAAIFSTLFVARMMIDTASTAVKWSDIPSVTHSNAPTVLPTTDGSDAFSRTYLSAVTHGSVAVKVGQLGRVSPKNFSRGDITSVTHN